MFIITAVFAAALAGAPQHSQMPPGMTHEEHLKQMQKEAELKKRGATAMGFDQDTTQHTFTAAADGGSIAVEVKDPKDAATRDRIRAHLKEITASFAQGDFTRPFQTHGEIPPGVPVMIEKKGAIRYTYAETPLGGIVRIRTKDAHAIEAVHEFLKYQTQEHNPK